MSEEQAGRMLDVAALEDRLTLAELRRDVSDLDHLIAEDGVFTSHDGRVYFKRDILRDGHVSGAPRARRLDVSDLRIKTYEATAVVTLRLGEGAPDGDLRCTRVWLLRGGRWQLVAGQTSPVSR